MEWRDVRCGLVAVPQPLSGLVAQRGLVAQPDCTFNIVALLASLGLGKYSDGDGEGDGAKGGEGECGDGHDVSN